MEYNGMQSESSVNASSWLYVIIACSPQTVTDDV